MGKAAPAGRDSLRAVVASRASAAQRSAGAAEIFVCLRLGHVPGARCAGRQGRNAILSTSERSDAPCLRVAVFVGERDVNGEGHCKMTND